MADIIDIRRKVAADKSESIESEPSPSQKAVLRLIEEIADRGTHLERSVLERCFRRALRQLEERGHLERDGRRCLHVTEKGRKLLEEWDR